MHRAIQKWEWRVVCLAAIAVGAQVGQAPVFAEGFAQKTSSSCSRGEGGITLPKGFCATIFADGIGHARQLVVAPEGPVYVNTMFPSTGKRPHSRGFGGPAPVSGQRPPQFCPLGAGFGRRSLLAFFQFPISGRADWF